MALCRLKGNGSAINAADEFLGRERGDILFPEDGYVSGLHCRLTWDGQRLFLTDLGSSNGTFVSDLLITEPTRLSPEHDVRLGDLWSDRPAALVWLRHYG